MTSETPTCPPPQRSNALQGLRILDLGRLFAAPWAGQLLGDLGADVIKVERAGSGDEIRGYGPPFLRAVDGSKLDDSPYSLAANRNKRSLAINIAHVRGQEVVRNLAARADILIENFKVGDLARYGLDYATLRRLHPGLIYCSITGFGQTGPRAKVAATDAIFQAMSGLMSITGEPDGNPQRIGVVAVDLLCGVYASTAILAALHHRTRSKQGQYIDLALLDVAMATMSHRATEYLLTGTSPTRLGTRSSGNVPARNFRCSDGDLCVQAGGDANFGKLCKALQRSDLATDARFAARGARTANAVALEQILEGIFARHSVEHWFNTLSQHGVYCGPVHDVAASYADPQVVHRKIRRRLPHPRAGTVDLIANPIRFPDLPTSDSTPPPAIGEHTESILQSELAMSPQDIDRLRQEGVI